MSIRVFNKPAVVIGGGASATLSSISISSNGTYSASAFGVDGFDVVDVNVQGSTVVSDKGLLNYLTNNEETFVAPSVFCSSLYAMKAGKFADYLTLKNVDLNRMTYIDSSCFMNVSLNSFNAPNVIMLAGQSALYSAFISNVCFPKLLHVGGAPQGYTAYCFYGMRETKVFSFPELRDANGNMFYNCSYIEEFYAPKLAIVSGTLSLSTCKISKLDLPSLVSCQITASTLSKLEYVSLPKFCGYINFAMGVSKLSSLYAPYLITYLSMTSAKIEELDTPYLQSCGTLAYCSLLKSVFMPVLSSYGYAPGCSNNYALSVVYIGACSSINQRTYYNCSALESLYILNCSSRVVTLGNVNVFQNSPMSNSTILGHYGSIYVPSSLVTSYKAATNWLAYSDRITAIPSEIESRFIFAYEFYSQSSITEIPSSKVNAEYVGHAAFGSCYNLTSVNLPNCKCVGASAFFNCTSLSSINLPECEVLHSAAFYNVGFASFSLPKVKYIMENALYFSWSRDWSVYDLPECVFIGSQNSFRGTSLTTVTTINLPNLVTCYNGWGSLFNLTTINLDNFVAPATSNVLALFSRASALQGTLSLPNLVARTCFVECRSVTSIYAPNLVADFSCSGFANLTSIYAPNFIKPGNFNAFLGTKLSSYNERKFITRELYGSTFNYCTNMQKYFNLNVESISTSVFYGCNNLNKVLFGGVSYIQETCFEHCSRLLGVYLFGNFVASFGSMATGSFAFRYTPISNSTSYTGGQHGSIYVPSSLYSAYINSSHWSWFSSRFVSLTDEEMQYVIDHWDD